MGVHQLFQKEINSDNLRKILPIVSYKTIVYWTIVHNKRTFSKSITKVVWIPKMIIVENIFRFLEYWIYLGFRKILSFQSPNLMNLSRFSNLPKTSFNWAPACILKNWIQFQMKPTIFERCLKFKLRLKFFKFGLSLDTCWVS